MSGGVVHVKEKVVGAVYIGRPGYWGNPFVIGVDGNRVEVVLKYREYAISRAYWDREFRAKVVVLKGKTLACWCGEKVCHGDVLLELADRFGN